jgi:hypothetical protein
MCDSSSTKTHVVHALMGLQLILSALSDSIWTRLPIYSAQNVETQSTGLHDPVTLILSIFGCRDT